LESAVLLRIWALRRRDEPFKLHGANLATASWPIVSLVLALAAPFCPEVVGIFFFVSSATCAISGWVVTMFVIHEFIVAVNAKLELASAKWQQEASRGSKQNASGISIL